MGNTITIFCLITLALTSPVYAGPPSPVLFQRADGSFYPPLIDSDNKIIISGSISGGGGTEYTEGDTDASITGTAILWEDAGNTLTPVNSSKPLPISAASLPLPSGASTSANQNTIIGHVDGIEGFLSTIDADTGNIATAVQLIDNAAATIGTTDLLRVAIFDASNNQITSFGSGTVAISQAGTDNDVDANITNSALAVTQSGTWDEVGINDSGNSITVDGTVTATQSTATSLKSQVFGDDTTQAIDTDAAGQLQVDVLTVPTVTVTASNLDVQIGGSDSLTIGTFPDNEPMNVAQMNGVAVSMGSGANGTGVQRVTIATDDETNDDLDAIRISTAAIDTDTTTIIGHVDGLEGFVDGIETLIGTTNTNTGNTATAVQIMDDWDNAASDGASVSGDVAHGSADAGEPVKLGGRAVDMQPDTEAEQGDTEEAEDDRVNTAHNLRGQVIEGVNSRYDLLTEIDTQLDDSPTSATSDGTETWNYRYATVGTCIDSELAPTDIQIKVFCSPDNSFFSHQLMNGALGQWIYDDTYTATEKCVAYSFEIACNSIKVQFVTTGTNATNYFTTDDSFIYLRN